MDSIRDLVRLARFERGSVCDLSASTKACRLIARRVNATRAYVLYSSESEGQRQLGVSNEMLPSPLDQEAFVVLGRQILEDRSPIAFEVEDGVIKALVRARAGVRRSCLAVGSKIHGTSDDVLMIEGIKRPLGRDDLDFVEAAALVVGRLAFGVIDLEDSNRRREQVRALADIGRVMANTAEKEAMLADLATAIAGASRFDVVAISALSENGSQVAYRALNDFRFSNHQVAEGFRAGMFDRHFLDVSGRRRPVVLRDMTVEDDEALLPPEKQVLVQLAVFASLVVLPLMIRDEVIGTISFCGYRVHELDEDELTLIKGLGAQAAMVIKGLDLCEELRVSKERLERTSKLLQESMSVEHRVARTDFLTGLPNRRYIEEALEGESAKQPKNGSLSVVLSDVDGFKTYNDEYGHAFGDDVLKLVATLARRVCGAGDIAARYAGDEFLFLLPRKTPSEARKVAQEFRKQVNKTELRTPGGHPLRLSVSVGISSMTAGNGRRPEEMLAEADAAMYRAKSNGGNAVSVASARATQTASAASAA